MLTKKILDAAKMCMDAYDPLKESPGKFFKSYDTDAEIYVALKGDTVFVCARGSEHILDWKHNFMLNLSPFLSDTRSDDNCCVHTGFLLQYLSIRTDAMRELKRLVEMEECKNILFTGHSAGTIASIFAYDFSPTCTKPIEVITFGSPRFCNYELAEIFNNEINCTRVVNDLDAVTLAPLYGYGYKHVGKLIHMRDSSVDSNELMWWEKGWWSIFNIFSITDHFINNYVSEIEKRL